MQLLRDEVDQFRGLAAYERDFFSAYRQRGYECRYFEVVVVRICSSSHNSYLFVVYRNLDVSINIFDCLLTAMAKVQSVDRKTSFLFVDNVNAHHEEWLGYSTTQIAR